MKSIAGRNGANNLKSDKSTKAGGGGGKRNKQTKKKDSNGWIDEMESSKRQLHK